MPLVITRDPSEFAERAWEFLQAGVERNVPATVFKGATEDPNYGTEPPLYAFQTDAANQLIALALRTPPWPLLATGFEDPGLAAELIRQWTPQDPGVPGITGEPATARAISAAWTRQTGGVAHCEFVEGMHVLTEVIPPKHPAEGRLRSATPKDRHLLVQWDRDFAIETGIGTGDNAERIVDRRLAAGRQTVWENQQEPVSTVGFNLEVAGTVRIGPVYTPPEHRAHGYATSAVAATSQMLLDGGTQQCMLYTDLANPISNHIYASIGYVRCGDWEQHGFHAPNLPN